MSSEGDSDSLSPSEERLLQHLSVLREDAPAPPAPLAAAVLAGARWQTAVRPLVQAGGILFAGMADSVRIMAERTAR